MEKILADIQKIIDNVSGPGLASIMTEAGDAGVQEGRARARVRTGRMRDSVHWQQEGNNSGKLEATVDYARAQEFGTSRFSGQPFITPGAEVVVQKAKEGLSKALSGTGTT